MHLFLVMIITLQKIFHKKRKVFIYFYSRQIPYYSIPSPGGGRGYYRLFEEIGCHFSPALAHLSFIQSQLIVMP